MMTQSLGRARPFRPVSQAPMNTSDRALMTYGWSAEHPGMAQAEWTEQCVRRLRELRPQEDAALLAELVNKMWSDVSRFHPVLAAEMEHESWFEHD
jgi:hypothetical protein